MNPLSIFIAAAASLIAGCAQEATPLTQQSTIAIPAAIQQVDKGILIVAYREGGVLKKRDFYSNGKPRGKTNEATAMAAGTYTITLGPQRDYAPEKLRITVGENGDHLVSFSKAASR